MGEQSNGRAAMASVVGRVRRRILRFLERRAAERREALVEQVIKLKKSLASADELGQKRPFTTSVVVPTFLRDHSELSGYRFEVVRNELIELGHLLRRGVADEIIIIDGSTKGSGAIDDSLMRQIVSTMNRSLSIFHDEVDLVQKYRVTREKAALGLYDFGVRVVHQLDPEIGRALKVSKAVPQGLPTGKGAALWLGIGLSSGDVVCFVDSDIRNFQGWQVAALLKPILETWKRAENSVLYSKAHYTRLAVNLDSPERGFYKLGGRATRLFVIPLIRALSKRGVLGGLERLRYPLSGEFAGKRTLFESVDFPAGYDAEMGVLIEIWKRGLAKRVEQVDLYLFQHFPQSDEAIHQMVKQIADLVMSELKDQVAFDQKLVDDYISEAMKDIAVAQDMYEKAEVRVEIEHEVKRDLFNDTEGDKKKVLAYAEELRRAIAAPRQQQKPSAQRLPNWESIRRDERGAKLLSFLRRRGTASTVELLAKQGLVSL
jgi:hypothetical protein